MARRTLAQRIALEGGAEIERELRQLGFAGQEAFRRLKREAEQLTSPLRQMQEELRRTGRSFQQLGRDVGQIGRTLSFAVTAPLVGFGALVVNTAGQFEAGMNRVRAILRPTTAEFESLRNVARELGATTQFSATEAADAIEMLGRNGLRTQEILGGAVDATLKLAAATGSELAPSADLITDILANFGLQSSELDRVVDNIAGTMVNSKFAFEDYSQAALNVVGVAGSMGASFEEVNAAIAATASIFKSGTEAGTSLRGFLQRLVPQSDAAAAAMEEFNLKFFDAEGNFIGLAEAAEVLRTNLAHLSTEQRMDVLNTIFGQRTIRTAIGLMREGADGIRDIAAAIEEVEAADMAAARMSGLRGALRELASAFEELQLAIADAGLLDFATNIVAGLRDFTRALAETDEGLLRFGSIIAGVVAVIGPFLIGIGLLIRVVGAAMIGLAALLPVLAALVTPIGLLVVGVTALAGGLVFLSTRQSEAQRAARDHAASLSEFQSAVEAANLSNEATVDGLRDLARERIRDAQSAFRHAEARIDAATRVREAELAATAGPMDPDTLRRAIDTDPVIRNLRDLRGEASLAVAEWEGELARLNAEAAGFTLGADRLAQEADDVREGIEGIGESVDRTSRLFDTAPDRWRERIRVVPEALGHAREAAEDFSEEAEDGFDRIGTRAEETADRVETLADRLIAVPGEFRESAEAASDAFDGITATIETGAASFEIVTGSIREVRTAADDASEGVREIGRAAAEIAQTDIGATIAAPFQAAADGIRQSWAGVVSFVQSGFSELTSSVDQAVRQIESAITRIIARLRAAAAEARRLSSAAGGAGSGFAEGGFAQAFAGGGRVSGPGTGTSDSIPAWLSHGEFVLTAKAVRQYGLDFLYALNGLKLPKDFLKGIKGYASGGLVQMPRFNVGGLVDGMMDGLSSLSPQPINGMALAGLGNGEAESRTPVNLQIGADGPTFQVFAGDDTISRLRSVSASQRRRSTGAHWSDGI
jgi:TP901 family phage tail tape measure protein